MGAVQVFDGDEIMLISDKGTLVRTRTDEVSSQGRNTQGVRLIKLKEDETLVGVERIEEPDEVPDYEDENETSQDQQADGTDTVSPDANPAGNEVNLSADDE